MVRDRSMAPRLPRGSIVLFSKRRIPKRGDTVLAYHPDVGKFVKRVSAIGKLGNVHFRTASSGSEIAGDIDRVPRADVLGVMIRRIGWAPILRSGRGETAHRP